jgi:ActR/RegA family two-component response regulator
LRNIEDEEKRNSILIVDDDLGYFFEGFIRAFNRRGYSITLFLILMKHMIKSIEEC